MSNKNPYEIRLELLKMAKELCDQQYNDLSNAYWSVVNNYCEQFDKTLPEVLESITQYKVPMYTPQDIMKKASELYTFVERTNSTSKEKN